MWAVFGLSSGCSDHEADTFQACRYLLRPPLAQQRLRRRADGRVLVELRKAWRDGTTHLLFEPAEFLEQLAALTPRGPRCTCSSTTGVPAPHARWRRQIVGFRRSAASEEAAAAARPKTEARQTL